MLITMTREAFEGLDDMPLIWACIEPTIRQIRGKNPSVKLDAYAGLTKGQQALLMFQILYGHTLQGVESFFLYQSYMLTEKGAWPQMESGMRYFGASEMARFLDEMRAGYEEYEKNPKDAASLAALEGLDARLRENLPAAIRLIGAYIRAHAEEFVDFEK